MIIERVFEAHRGAESAQQTLDALRQLFADCIVKRTHASLQLSALGDNVERTCPRAASRR